MNKFQLKKLKENKNQSNTQRVHVDQINSAIRKQKEKGQSIFTKLKNNYKNYKTKKANTPKTPYVRKKNPKKDLIATILTIIVAFICVCFISGIIVILVLLQDKPTLDPNDFISQESSIIYDRQGNIISELGQTIRKNVTYDDLPTSLVDAFVAVEDSRFFEHNGFDVPRFTKAFIENIKTMSFGQGGSTFTMQLIKNTYFVDDEAGRGAAKSIKRKVQEIALAIELENNPSVSKKDIFVAYLNKLYFGGTYQNIRGVQKAAEYYFSKQVNELTLPESAMLAGVVNAPNLYNPYNHMDYAQERRDEVLYLMYYHGYITENEYNVAISTKVEDFLKDSSNSNRGAGEGTPYQAYIDQVVEEVYELTGLDPYTTSMRIYTAMDKTIQERMDEIQAEKVDDNYYRKEADKDPYFYPNDKFEVASICVDNVTGEIYGILGGRNYADGGALLLNHATQQFKQPGSSIKPILDYSQAFEVLGWSTSHYVTDKPITYPGTGILIGNSNGTYQGDIPLKHAVYESLNTTAISTLQSVIDNEKGGSKYLSNYLNTIGFNVDPNEFNVQYAIGGSSLEVTCLQMAGAQAMLINHGKYNKPHAVLKIEFLNEKPPIVYETQTVQALSPEAAYLTTELLKFNVSGNVTKEDGSHYVNLMELLQDDYQVYAKTGTTNWDSSAKVYDIPNGSIKDGWTIASTSKVTVATWMGYEKAEKVDDTVYGYIPYDIYNRNIKGKIAKMILNTTVDVFGKPEPVSKPDGIQTISHITIPGKPYVAPIDGMPEEYITTGLIKKSSYGLIDAQTVGIEQMNGTPTITYSNGLLTVSIPSYPNPTSTANAEHKYDISLYGSDGNLLFFKEPIYGRKSFDYAWIYGTIKYKADIKVNGSIIKSESSDGNNLSIYLHDYLNSGILKDGDNLTVSCYYGFDSLGLNSNKVDSNSVTVTDQVTITIPNTMNKTEAENYLKSFNPGIGNSVSSTLIDGATPGQVISISLANGTITIRPGESKTVKRSDLTGAVISYYEDISMIKLTVSSPQVKGTAITVTAKRTNFTDEIEWEISLSGSNKLFVTPNDYTIGIDENNENTLTFTPEEAGTYIVSIKKPGESDYLDTTNISVSDTSTDDTSGNTDNN